MNTYLALQSITRALHTPALHQTLRRSPHVAQLRHSSKYSKVIKNEKIPHDIVRVVDSETDRLAPAVSLKALLASIDKEQEDVYLVSTVPVPVVKVMNKREVYEKKKVLKAQAKSTLKRNVQKEAQMSWTSAPADLAHKMKKMREDLEKGYKVDLVLTIKRGSLPTLPTPKEMNARLDEILNQFADVAKEWKAREVRKTAAVLSLQGRSSSSVEETEET
ncbi:hypothetical protein BDN72DRAFT_833265 [Pluteus cervinus]|uniref:Uncharacterized protein n=1 Tax=Pluteus cervinus TaxID=181527 RepID=A0ACD3B9P1_9AGAR|nr:hypothetical protein BDN72DRAFT_833265 [Pluteus cervinus]